MLRKGGMEGEGGERSDERERRRRGVACAPGRDASVTNANTVTQEADTCHMRRRIHAWCADVCAMLLLRMLKQ